VTTASTKRRGQRKTIEQVVSYAISHKTRVHILIVLNEGTFTPAEIAEIIGVPLTHVSNHIRSLADDGAIELAKTELKRNTALHYYRAVEIPFYTDEEVAALTPEQIEVHTGLVIQSMVAELLASLWGAKFRGQDRRMLIAWDWVNVDRQGRQEVADEQERSWNKIQEIEADATNRRVKSGEDAKSFIVASAGFERARKGPVLRSRNR
jgi:DNA-binding transcriptional ArsR family regulator